MLKPIIYLLCAMVTLLPLKVLSQNNTIRKLSYFTHKEQNSKTNHEWYTNEISLYKDQLRDTNSRFYLFFDKRNIYLRGTVKTKVVSSKSKSFLEKDDERIAKNKWVALCIDGYGDALAAQVFMVDEFNNQLDGGLNTNGDFTLSYNGKWTSLVTYGNDSYDLEIKVPFSSFPNKMVNNDAILSINIVRFNGNAEFNLVSGTSSNKLALFHKYKIEGVHLLSSNNKSGIDINSRQSFKINRIKHFDTSELSGRSLAWGDASVIDYKIFMHRTKFSNNKPSIIPAKFENSIVQSRFNNLAYTDTFKINNLDNFLERTATTNFIVLNNDTIRYLKYYNGSKPSDTCTSFSMAKSMLGTLLPYAINDGFIKSESDLVTKYLNLDFIKDTRVRQLRVSDLISMSSGIHYDDHSDDGIITYYHPDLRKATIEHLKFDNTPGELFNYNNYNPILTAMILEKVTGKTVSDYLNEKIWKPMGGSYFSWSTDNTGFEKSESGINASAIDFLKFGKYVLDNLKSEKGFVYEWLTKATQPQLHPESYYPDYFNSLNLYYGYYWWGIKSSDKDQLSDFFAMGNKGEYIYISPEKNTVIVRLGFEYGTSSMSWPILFHDYLWDNK